MNNIAAQIKEAVENAKSIIMKGGVDYLTLTLNQRTPGHPDQAGSCFTEDFLTRDDGTVETVYHRLFEDHLEDWTEYVHCPGLMEGCKAFILHKAGIGKFGMVNLNNLDPEDVVTVDDRKGTGWASVIYHGDITLMGVADEADFAVAIVGDEGGKPTLFTVHPGNPLNPARVKSADVELGKTITVWDAQRLGFTHAKLA